MQPHLDKRVDLADRVTRALRLGPADIGLAVDDLALQVGLVDHVELDDADGAHPCGGQVQQRRRAQPACADDQHLGVLQPFLPVHPQVRDDEVTAVARDLFTRQFGRRFYQRRQRCRHRNLLDCSLLTITAGTAINSNETRAASPRRRAQAIGYGQGLNRQVLPSGLTDSGSNRAASLLLVENVCCIITGASSPLSPHGSWR